MEPGTLLVVALVVAGIAGVLLLPRRRQWNADGEADAERARRATTPPADDAADPEEPEEEAP